MRRRRLPIPEKGLRPIRLHSASRTVVQVDRDDLRTYLNERIPLSRALGIDVLAARPEEVTLSAPLAPNINHQETVFGGSAAAVAMLAAWGLLQVRLEAEGVPARVVIHRGEMTFSRPIAADFTATAVVAGNGAWALFMEALRRRGRGRIHVSVALACEGDSVAAFEGDFVAMGDSR
jgi:thioesterase domain-containing protein